MTFYERAQTWKTSWEAWTALIVGGVGSIAAVAVALKRCVVLLNKAYESGLFLIDIKESMAGMERRIVDQLNKLDEGQQNIIQARRVVMERADAQKGWFEAKLDGNFEWVSFLWTAWTGINANELLAHGWESSIAQEERENVLEEWSEAFAHERIFQMDVTIVSIAGQRVRVHLSAWPMKKNGVGKALSYLGHAIKA